MEMIIMGIVVLILWLTYAYTEGEREAWYWVEKNDGNIVSQFNEHGLFFQQRLIIGVIATLTMIPDWITAAVFGVAMILTFPFFHNGRMYQVRNDITPKIYKERWEADPSPTSTAKTNLSYITRLGAFSIGIAGVVVYILMTVWS